MAVQQIKITDSTKNLHWFVYYTKPRAEKKVAEKLTAKGFEHYLPLMRTLKQWSDRRKMVEEPVFKSYIFVRTSALDIKKVLIIEGILKVIHFGGQAQAVPNEQMMFLQTLLENPDLISISQELQTGARVKIVAGPLSGIQGVLVRRGKPSLFGVNIDLVGQSVLVELPAAYLQKII